jgi:polar amino acid transport system substrate-binding protein
MNACRRHLIAWPIAAALLAACSTLPVGAPPEARATLAPIGTLRVGVYPGSPTSMIRGPGADEMRGVSVDIGRELARRLGVPAEIVIFARAAEVVQAVQTGRVDVTVTNATPARARDVDFTTPLIGLELGYLVLPGSSVASADTVDRPGVRIGVSQGSSSQAALSRIFKHAVVVPAASLTTATDLLKTRQVDAFATNKAILFELADALPGAKVLDGRWGLEHLAIAVPKGRDAGMAYLQRFADEMRAGGGVQRAAVRAGLRGTASPDAH